VIGTGGGNCGSALSCSCKSDGCSPADDSSCWKLYASTVGWTLAGDFQGEHRASVKFSEGGNYSKRCSDSIIYDTVPPTSAVSSLPEWTTAAQLGDDYDLDVSWSGDDNMTHTCGPLRYWFQYNRDGGAWIDLVGSQSNPKSDTHHDFLGEEGILYCFRTKALDGAGNWEENWPWPEASGDTCTTLDLSIQLYGFGYTLGDSQPDVRFSVSDRGGPDNEPISGIRYSSFLSEYPSNCEYSSDGGSSWTAAACSYSLTDPSTVSFEAPFPSQSPTNNLVHFRACDNAGNCAEETHTVDNRTTGPWVQTFGGDVHSNAGLWLRRPD